MENSPRKLAERAGQAITPAVPDNCQLTKTVDRGRWNREGNLPDASLPACTAGNAVLSCTFRARKKGKRVKSTGHMRQIALQALAKSRVWRLDSAR
jgi:hypothetical protein